MRLFLETLIIPISACYNSESRNVITLNGNVIWYKGNLCMF